MAFRSVPRPSSPPGAKASTECPFVVQLYPHHALNIEHIQNTAHHKQEPSIRFLPLPPLLNFAARNSILQKPQRQELNPTAFDRLKRDEIRNHTVITPCFTWLRHMLLNTRTFMRQCFTAINRSTGQTTHAKKPGLDHSNTRTQMHQNLFTLTKNIAAPRQLSLGSKHPILAPANLHRNCGPKIET
jgi:hypothetical protein